jgi:hypothetical protein
MVDRRLAQCGEAFAVRGDIGEIAESYSMGCPREPSPAQVIAHANLSYAHLLHATSFLRQSKYLRRHFRQRSFGRDRAQKLGALGMP